VRSSIPILSFIAVALACVSCKVADEEPPPPTRTAPAPEQFEPLAASPGRVLSADGRIAGPRPEAFGWECLEERHGDASATAVALRCRRENPREFLFLAAKTHRQPPDQRTDAHTLLMSLYRADNEAFFDRVEYVRDGPAELAGGHGWEAELEAEHARLGVIRKRERVAIIGDRIYAISAEGKPELWTQQLAVIDRWFAEVEFARPSE
jgi:hypothetical protein